MPRCHSYGRIDCSTRTKHRSAPDISPRCMNTFRDILERIAASVEFQTASFRMKLPWIAHYWNCQIISNQATRGPLLLVDDMAGHEKDLLAAPELGEMSKQSI